MPSERTEPLFNAPACPMCGYAGCWWSTTDEDANREYDCDRCKAHGVHGGVPVTGTDPLNDSPRSLRHPVTRRFIAGDCERDCLEDCAGF